jgi:sortase (surface protein transpeptidase)
VRLASSAARGLTLITCYPFGFIGHAPKRFLVFAHQLEAAGKDIDPEPVRTEVLEPPSGSDGTQRLK